MHKTISIPTITVMAVATEFHHDFLIIAKSLSNTLILCYKGWQCSFGDIYLKDI